MLATMNDAGGLFTYSLTSPLTVRQMAERLLSYNGFAVKGTLEGTGLRPGEKLTESFLASDEASSATTCDQILKVHGRDRRTYNCASVSEELREACDEQHLQRLIRAVKAALPEYEPSSKLLNLVAACAR